MDFRSVTAFDANFLYQLLEERPSYANISHIKLPSYTEHCEFVDSEPYKEWLIIEVDGDLVGSVYITDRSEIGIAIKKKYQGNGYATMAIQHMQKTYDPIYANISPTNIASLSLFVKLGANMIQHTYKLEQ